jgi:fimbrial chaperone protein
MENVMSKSVIPVVRLLAALGTMVPCASFAQSGPVLIWPIDPAIEQDKRATALWLENPGKVPIQLQVRVFAWQQSENGDHYAPQSEVIGTPPMVRIEPGQRQLVRLTRTQATVAGSERAYRVIVDEVPLPEATAGESAGARIKFRMRYAIPLFSYGHGLARPGRNESDIDTAKPPLEWSIVQQGGKRFLEIRNPGPTHVRLVNAAFASDKAPFAPGLLGYVLAGATMRWALPNGTGGGQLRVTVNGVPAALDARGG